MDPGHLWPFITILGAAVLGVSLAYGMMRSAPGGRRKVKAVVPIVGGVLLLIGGVLALTGGMQSDEHPAIAAGAGNLVGATSAEELERSVAQAETRNVGTVSDPEAVAEAEGAAGG